MPRIHKAPVRYNRAEVLVAYLKGETVELSYTKNADDTCKWEDIVPYNGPMDVYRLTNSEYSFRIKEEKLPNGEPHEVQFKEGDKVKVVGNMHSHGFPIGSICEYDEIYNSDEDNHWVEGFHTGIGEMCFQILHRSDFVKV